MAWEAQMLVRLKSMRVQTVNETPEWKHCFNISFEPGGYNREVFLNLIAGKLVHDKREPLELAKSDRQLWVRIG